MRLVDHIRALPHAGLAALLRARPDLLVPAPTDLSALATRAQSRLSVARALEGLDLFTLEILDALRLAADPAGVFSELLAMVGDLAPEPAVRAALDRLRALALVYGPDGALHVVPAVDELCSPYPAGLGRRAAALDADAADLVTEPAKLRKAVLAAPPEARAVLDRLAAGPPLGALRDARRADGSAGPVRWLITHRLLVPVSDDTVELPREVGLLLRHGPLCELHPAPPPLDPPLRDQTAADSAGAGQVMEVVRQCEAVLDSLAGTVTPVLRSGGLGVRDLRRIARDARVTEPVAAVLAEVCHAAGLLDDDRTADPVWLPTHAYDRWLTEPAAIRWVRLAVAWLEMPRQVGLVGQRDDRDRPVNALSPEVERMAAPVLRRACLAALADLPIGAGAGADDLAALLAWQAPRRGGRHRDDAVRWSVAEAAALGITGLGALTTYGRRLLAAPGRAADELDVLLPVPVDHLLIQTDLTVVVPGPPEPELAGELALLADVESSGGASVYRITPASIRRAMDAGMGTTDIHALLARRSRTPVPQALHYLVEDMARRHGGLRTGPASAYLRSDDEALLTELLSDRSLGDLRLRRLAPTVLVAASSVRDLLDTLRDAGYAPVAEDTSGAAVLTRPRPRRAPVRTRTRRPDNRQELDDDQLAAVVDALRSGDAAARAARRAPVSTTVTAAGALSQAISVIQAAIRERSRVRVGFVDAHGEQASWLVRPLSIAAGYLRAEDDRTETMHTFALHRITSAALAES